MNYAVVMITNEKFKDPLNVVLYGLSKYNFLYDVIIYYDKFFEELNYLKKAYCNLNIIYKQIDCEKYNDIKWTIHTRDWEINPFYRYEIFTLSEYDKILYIDIDIVILDCLNDIFNQEGDFCAVELAKVTNLAYVPFGQRGFNAGVMLIGRKYLNKDVQLDLINITKSSMYNGNQKPLNFYFTNKVDFLDYKYNLTTDLLTQDRIENAKIIHFIGEQKPWNHLGLDSFCEYVKRISGEYLLIKVYNMYKKEQKEALGVLNLKDLR